LSILAQAFSRYVTEVIPQQTEEASHSAAEFSVREFCVIGRQASLMGCFATVEKKSFLE
jgi:hypothetical protein